MDKEMEKAIARAQAINDQARAELLDEIKEKYLEAKEDESHLLLPLLECTRISLTTAIDQKHERDHTDLKEGMALRLMALGGLMLQEAMAEWHQEGILDFNLAVMEGSRDEIKDQLFKRFGIEEDGE